MQYDCLLTTVQTVHLDYNTIIIIHKYQDFVIKVHLYYSVINMLQFWQKVKEELEYNLITQKELAEKIGISYNTLQSWITKDRLPDAEQALKIAKQLNTSIEYLVTGKNEEKNGIKKNLQEMIPKLNHLSNENLELINLIAGRLK